MAPRLPAVAFAAATILLASCGSDAVSTTTTGLSTSTTAATATTSAASAPPATSTTVPEPTTTIPEITLPGTADELDALLADIDHLAEPQARAAVDDLWGLLEGRVPFADGEHVVFLYRGEASRVEWKGDFTGWSWGLLGRRIGQTDLWAADAVLPGDARIEYQVVVDTDEWILDPANSATQMGGFGPNSVLTMPGFATSDFGILDPVAPMGSFTDDIPFDSTVMGYTIDVRVYVPAGISEDDLIPVLYVTDGSDFWDPTMGAMTVVLDNLIAAGRIEPVMAVFADAWDPDHAENRREVEFLDRPVDYAAFLDAELVPWIDAAYPTEAAPERRAIVGTSYGGAFAAFAATLHPETFGNLVMFSPALWVLQAPEALGDPVRVAAMQQMGALLDESLAACSAGTCPVEGMRIAFTSGIPEWDVGDLSGLADTFEALGFDYLYEHAAEGHTWGQWSGLTDEILEFLFPP
jgi:enterochelin esterase family protein